VSHADRKLIAYARQFYEAIQKIASLDQWRTQYHVSASYWWWYLDVIAYAANVLVYPSEYPRRQYELQSESGMPD
jgi:hypothetical protein